jgi:hypothetical protein
MEPSRLRRGKGAFLLPLTHDQPCADWMRGKGLEICPCTLTMQQRMAVASPIWLCARHEAWSGTFHVDRILAAWSTFVRISLRPKRVDLQLMIGHESIKLTHPHERLGTG